MEKFGKLLGTTYLFTQSEDELPSYLIRNLQQYVQFESKREKFLGCCWIKNFLSKGHIFLLVTDRRIAYRDPSRIEQNLFSSITGIEQNIFKNICVHSAGNTTKIFRQSNLPSQKLLNKLFALINTHWLSINS